MRFTGSTRTPCSAGGFFFPFLCLWAALCAALWYFYSRGLYFGWGFDDEAHLRGLGQVHDVSSALVYVFDGHAGPLGRPLALATFLAQSGYWPEDPAEFVRANILLHIANTALVAWLALRLHPYVGWMTARAESFALLSAALWSLSPVLLSTSLLTVQRMASLSAFFCLCGAIAYVCGRELLATRRTTGLAVMSAGVALGTALATLSKENGVLLPLLLLCLEYFLLRQGGRGAAAVVAPPRWWTVALLWLPAVAVVGFVLRTGLLGGIHYPGRDFDLLDRLLTEPRALLRYLRLLIVPVRSDIGPLQAMPISAGLLSPLSTLASMVGLTLLAVAALLVRRTRYRMAGFAVAWFLAGHVLESSVFGLEIYFEHRNYLPSVGIYLALAAIALHAGLRPAWRASIIVVLLANQAFVLSECSRLWQQPMLAGALWRLESPSSLRALQLYVFELGREGRLDEVRDLLREPSPALEHKAAFRLYRLEVLCDLGDEAAVRSATESAFASMRSQALDTATSVQIARIADVQGAGGCAGQDAGLAERLFQAVVDAGSRASPEALAGAHYRLAERWIARRDLDRSLDHLEKGLAIAPQLPAALTTIAVLESAGLHARALDTIAAMKARVPRRPFVRAQWLESLDAAQRRLESR